MRITQIDAKSIS